MPDPDNITLERAAAATEEMLQEKPDLSVFPDAPPELVPPPAPRSAIDMIRPDRALAAGVAHQIARRQGQTGWEPTPRNNRVYPPNYNGAREKARRTRQVAR